METTAEIAVRERPILFSGEMVRAILDNLKTQTRRVIKHPEYFGCLTGDCPHWDRRDCARAIADFARTDSPYGVPGDRLWVRETFIVTTFGGDQPLSAIPKHPGAGEVFYAADAGLGYQQSHDAYPGRWRPSIHMPRWASRITLEVVKVRVERVQDISETDAEAEGVEPIEWHEDHGGCPGDFTSHRHAYAELWDAINDKRGYSWDSNPWVWVIEFKRIQAE